MVSAYKDKVLRRDGAYIRQEQVCPASMYNHPPAPLLTFPQFVSCVINQASSEVKNLTQFGAGENLDSHWKPQTLLCNFCVTDFNIIGHLEHMDDDVSCAVRQLGMKSRSEEHTSELQSRETISYAVFCLKKKKNKQIMRYLHYQY